MAHHVNIGRSMGGEHKTAGDHCEHCAPLYNDQPWQAANGIIGAPHECKSESYRARKFKCTGHADSCHFDRGVWLASGCRGGGVCDSCRHNTEGRHCQSCTRGFYRHLNRPSSAPDSCTRKRTYFCLPLSVPVISALLLCCYPSSAPSPAHRCDCHPVGSVPSLSGCDDAFCNRSNGACTCRPWVGGPILLMLRIVAAHDQGSHAEVEVKVKKVLYHSSQVRIQRGHITLFPESWTTRGCTCRLHFAQAAGSEYLVGGHEDWRMGHLLVNTKSLVKPWRPSLGLKLLHLLNKHCSTSSSRKTAVDRLLNMHISSS
ncbi:unnamed protein product [Coregonus sp. 'balchen']|nr:unnamed protein product [Coregonus sp. 'balchen']